MKAYTINKYSKADKLQLIDAPEPIVNENEVLVEIHAASVNQLDAKIKSGEFKLLVPYKFPLILGHDVAGIISKVGSKVSRFKIGDEVFARPADLKIGTFAEFIAINENDVALKPKNISMEEAASIPLVALTVWQAFVEKAKLQKGQKVFIQAGSGGVGTIAIQLAKHLGATVATTTSASNFELVKNLGADVVIDYKTQDFETILKDYDLVLNSQDAKSLEKSFHILKSGGKVISISGPPDTDFAKEIGLSWFMKMAIFFLSRKAKNQARKLGVDYSFLFMRANGKQLSEIGKLIETGVIRPIIDKVFPFEQTNDAMAYVESGRAKGKVVVKVK
ncbi:NADP-dependent oxidoreductase [Chryseobacterium sp. Ch-15]|uniref:NADP-dependent oxidoreductase n=1 Tax=Chryseobacterium muglaense TaxID=2893752 RepID=A0A9Q3YWX0_9FLAO|nr:NADP-dependent oxidoreductase [Chryseobacterium muglaense]MBD3903285.1 NADP-dependent oxidoreductase [Chryseobacterium muglaense]MCC9036115.1 NADP-dependent oxidoreductase [Chryseobacterium muglaense]MCM2553309.1 NADP-dependent oxidoreductase [Chryseobacterium muglaense]